MVTPCAYCISLFLSNNTYTFGNKMLLFMSRKMLCIGQKRILIIVLGEERDIEFKAED